jgi:asparagine synthase (glutamine-hydrolysing)
MRDLAASRGPDAASEWLCGEVGLAHRMLHTTPESLAESQPWKDESGQIVLIYDGRVDNRNDLRGEFAAHGLTPRNCTDAELLLRAYQRWGEDFPIHILGDFAVTIWDGRRKSLFCARDVFGFKPLYYLANPRCLVCASAVQQFFAHPAFTSQPDEMVVAGHLSGFLKDNEGTLYAQLRRLAPATSLTVSSSRLEIRRYWNVDTERTIRYRTDDEYAEHFRAIFSDAVGCRLRSQRPVGIALSGGVDSSCLTGMAKALERSGDVQAPAIEMLSMVFPGQDCDESAYIQQVAEFWKSPVHTVEPTPADWKSVVEEVVRVRDLPQPPNGSVDRSFRAMMQTRGVRVLLDGKGGDEWLGGSLFHHADLLSQLHLSQLISQFRADRQLGSMDWEAFVRQGIGPLFPESWRRARRKLMGVDPGPLWLGPELARRTGLWQTPSSPPSPVFPSHAQTRIYRDTLGAENQALVEIYERSYAECSLDVRSPLWDRRVVEFALAIPEEQRWRGLLTKFVMRRATEPWAPPAVLARTDKAGFERLWLPALEVAGGERFFSSLQIARLGWVSPEGVLAIYRQTAAGWGWKVTPKPCYIWPLWTILGLELWHRSICATSQT